MIILGGIGHLRGALLGAFAFTMLQEFFQSQAIFGAVRQALAAEAGTDHHRLRRALPRGLIGLPTAWRGGTDERCPAAEGARPSVGEQRESRRARDEPRTAARRACRVAPLRRPASPSTRFRSNSNAACCMRVIGTNGAGKSTLINMLSGESRRRATAASNCSAATSPHWSAAAARARRPGPQLPAQHACFPSFTRARELPARRAGAHFPRAWALDRRRPHAAATACRRRQAALERVGLGASRRPYGDHAVARRKGASSRSPMCLATQPGAAARRTAGRHRRGRDRPHAGAARTS